MIHQPLFRRVADKSPILESVQPISVGTKPQGALAVLIDGSYKTVRESILSVVDSELSVPHTRDSVVRTKPNCPLMILKDRSHVVVRQPLLRRVRNSLFGRQSIRTVTLCADPQASFSVNKHT